KFINKVDASILITDFDPLKIKREWKQKIIDRISIPFYEVDAHNIVPIWVATDKQEFAAYTLRPKIMKQIDNFLTDYPELKKHPFNLSLEKEEYIWDEIIKHLPVNRSISKIDWILPGEKQAKKVLSDFISNKLKNYDDFRNDPNENAQSNLSPYLHFGQISSQRVAYEIKKLPINNKSKDSFLEELIVRKELSDNYCYYCNDYDNFNGFPEWAKKTLDEHRKDKREYVYSLSTFEEARTHDNLWNAAQIEMITTGKMHGYMRMYWAKKILEWTNSPEEAQEIAIYLNDKYELDGRDPNGYTGIAWSIGGVHDRAWFSKQVYGKVRYMSYNGCKNKFDINAYIKKYNKI
ncbi:MAG TPA: deoxyribodipyrimidine photolyase, partial [Bacteroidota bacterium]|nr:deoxyribodipyrimidine photolyase [Bacteroidota bacterium]